MKKVLQINKLNKKFNNLKIIENLSLEIKEGDRATIFAPSGSGKSTLINILAGLDKDYNGEYSFDINDNLSIIFQKPSLFPHKTVKENIFYPFKVKKISITNSILEDYKNWINIVGLNENENTYPFQLSGGMKQKTSIIRSFLFKPDFIMMDEPFASIDINSKKKIIEFLLSKYANTTKMLVTHNLDDISLLKKSKLFLFKKRPLRDYQLLKLDSTKKQDFKDKLTVIFEKSIWFNED